MKRFLTLLMLLSVVNVFSQQTTKTLVSINSYQYNSGGKETENHSYTVVSGQAESSDFTYTSYNGNGNIIQKYVLNALNDTTEKTIYLYESQKITITSYTYTGSLITPNQKTIYYSVDDYEETDELFVKYFLEIPMYKCDSFQVYSWNLTEWQLSTSGKYTYSNTHPTKLIMNMQNYMGETPLDFQVTYTYNSKNNCTKMAVSILMYTMPFSLMDIDQTFNSLSLCTETHIYPNINPLLEQYISADIIGEEKIKYDYNTHNDLKTLTISTYIDSLGIFKDISINEYVYKQATVGGNVTYLVDTVYGYYFNDFVSVVDLKLLDITIFPNPATDNLYLKGITSSTTINIYDISGKQIISKTLNANENTLNIESFKPGMYLLKIQNVNGVYVSKFLKK